jgi:hypothetical protein
VREAILQNMLAQDNSAPTRAGVSLVVNIVTIACSPDYGSLKVSSNNCNAIKFIEFVLHLLVFSPVSKHIPRMTEACYERRIDVQLV